MLEVEHQRKVVVVIADEDEKKEKAEEEQVEVLQKNFVVNDEIPLAEVAGRKDRRSIFNLRIMCFKKTSFYLFKNLKTTLDETRDDEIKKEIGIDN